MISLARQGPLAHFADAIEAGDSLLIEELWDAPKAALVSWIAELTGRSVVILTGGQRENRLFDDSSFFTNLSVHEFPAWETLPSEEVAPSPDIVGERYEVLRQLLDAKGPSILLCPLQSALQRVVLPKQLREAFRTVRKGDEVVYEQFIAQLEALGFVRRPVAADKGEYAVRGGVIDLFPVGSPDPFRLEFWGDEVEAIRRYDPVGQKSVGTADEVRLAPAREDTLIHDQLASLFDYFTLPPILILDDLLALEDRYVSLSALPKALSRHFVSLETLLKETAPLQKLYWTATPVETLGEIEVLEDRSVRYYSAEQKPHPIRFPFYNQTLEAKRWQSPFVTVTDYFVGEGEGDLIPAFSKAVSEELALHFVADTPTEEDHLRALLSDAEVPLPRNTDYHRGYLSSGLVVPEGKLAIVPTTELTHRYKIRRQKQRSTYHTPPTEFTQLTPGDLVVHIDNGIGRYLGVEQQPNVQGVLTEYLAVEYAEQGKLYIPLTQSHLINRYIGAHEEKPKLHQLGGKQWARTKAVTERAIRDYAEQLLRMHAERSVAGGFAFLPDDEEMLRFEQEFPYVETEDQLTAIAAVKQDMMADKPMDRLVCGDVGYGKTEVAMRAAMKAVESGKQVAILVPTTVLAIQHFDNFSDRMANFPVTVGVLSRFRTAKQIRETLEGVQKGSIDILIGTHRILSKDVSFADLGLVIIDEEQRFGVRVKEKIRAFKAGVDCLTLTATPIPRTLYLSLLGARDLSTINTPPQDRLPIKTILCEDDDKTIQNALLRELARDGQIFVIHNRVETIDRYAARMQKLVPKARVIAAHGQMHADELDTIFHAFKKGEIDILVATTIVENGIDIPNANTIIIDRADRYGLADLYQLRGRVGRWMRRAYAYFLTPKRRALSEIAHARLEALLHVGGYGGGMKLAMRDLEIRGAGNILGTEQSGYVSRIGFHLYCRLLKQKVDSLQGKMATLPVEPKLELPFDARIPEDYIAEPTIRMELYARFGEAIEEQVVDTLLEEVRDRFGRPPEPVLWLHRLMRLRIIVAKKQITLLKLKRFTLTWTYRKGKKQETRSRLIKEIKTPQQLEEAILQSIGAG